MKKIILFTLILTVLLSAFTVCVFASEEAGDGTTEAQKSQNFFELIFEKAKAHSEKILSAVAAIGSLFLAFTYKKGLLPALKTGIDNLRDSVVKLKKESEAQSESSSSLLITASEQLKNAEDMLTSLSSRLSELEVALRENAESKDEREKFKLILLSQTDMLYDIFMTSSLPQYQKDAVGEKIADMKEKIKIGE